MSYTQMRNPPAPFTQSNPQQIHANYGQNSRMPFNMPPNSNPQQLAQQQQSQQQPQQHTPTQQQQQQQVPPQQQPAQSNNQAQQTQNPQARMAPAQQPQGTQQAPASNTPGQQPQQQNTFHQQGQQQTMQQQQQQGSQQQQTTSAQPQPGQHVIHPGYQASEHTAANPAPFVYPTNQRMNLPNQTHQAGGPAPPAAQAQGHHAFNTQYMYQQPYNGHIGYYDQSAYGQTAFINSQTNFVPPQGYIYQAPVNIFNRSKLSHFIVIV